MNKRAHIVVTSATMLLFATKARAEEACRFVQIDIMGADRGIALDLNNWGQVVGMLGNSDPYTLHPFVWHDGKTRVLPALESGYPAAARAINDGGRIVGSSSSARGDLAVTWFRGQVDALPGPAGASATAINNRGQIAGYIHFGSCLFWPDADSEPIVLPGLGGVQCHPTAISDGGVVVGTAESADGVTHAFTWENGVMSNAGPSPTTPSQMRDISALGFAVGVADIEFVRRPIVRVGGRTDVLPPIGTAEAVNIWGTIAVLGYTRGPNETHLLLADGFGNFRDKGTLGGSVADGTLMMNDRFQIAWNVAPIDGSELLPPHFCQLR